MIPPSQAATSTAQTRGARATTSPATTSTTPTMYIAVCALPGMMSLNCGARYFVQSSHRTPANLSRPKRIGATVKAIRSSRKACTAGSLRTSVRVGKGAVRVLIAPSRPVPRVVLRRQRPALLDQGASALIVFVAVLRQHADGRAALAVPDRERGAVLGDARLVEPVAPGGVLERVRADGRDPLRHALPLRVFAGDRAARDRALVERLVPVLDGQVSLRARVVGERDVARGVDALGRAPHARVGD